MKLKLLMGMFGAKFGLLWDRVLYNPYAHSPDSDSLRHACIRYTTINSDPTTHRGYYCVQPALTLENLHFAHRMYLCSVYCASVLVGPCHHGMARPQVADRGTASDKEGSCE